MSSASYTSTIDKKMGEDQEFHALQGEGQERPKSLPNWDALVTVATFAAESFEADGRIAHCECNECDAYDTAMDSDVDEVETSTESVTGTTTPPESIIVPTDHTRHLAAEQEMAPPLSQDIVFLNMTPFSCGQNAMSNQNRLVANEAIVAQLIRGLQTEIQTLRHHHVNMDLAHRRILLEHKNLIDKTTVQMLERYKYCRDNLGGLVRFVNQSNTAHQQAILSLKKSIRDPKNGDEVTATATCESADVRTPIVPQTNDSMQSGGPSTDISDEVMYNGRATSADVALGPINCDIRAIHALVESFVIGVGLIPHMVKRVGVYSTNPDFIQIQFLKDSYAHKFVALFAFNAMTESLYVPLTFMADEWDRNAGAIADARAKQK